MSTTAQQGRAAGFSIAHITDTHLGAQHRDFEPNFLALIDEMKHVAPDLIINTGDLTVNGTEEDADHQRAHELHQRLTPEWRVLPGNHDVGDNPRVPGEVLNKPVTAQRRDRYCAVWGADFWGTDAGEFRLIGLNAQLCGSDLAEEADQWDFLAQERSEHSKAALLRCFCTSPCSSLTPTRRSSRIAMFRLRRENVCSTW